MPSWSVPVFDTKGNQIGIACGRSPRRRCSTEGCAATATIQCDFPVTRRGKPGTCDRWVCVGCATKVGPDRDHCGPHARAQKRK